MIARKTRFTLLFASLCLALAACGSTTSPGDDDDNGAGNGNNGGGNGNGGNGGGNVETDVRFGSFDNQGNFQAGVLKANKTSLIAGESAGISASLVDGTGAAVTDAVDIFFSSPCIGMGTAEVDPPVATNATGTVNTTYTARGCTGSDRVTGRTSVDGASLTASVDLQTEQAPLGSIQFQEASNPLIGIQGSGALPEQSTLSFLVTNTSGGPVANREVTFTLNTQVGGISLSNNQDTTDANGRVSTTINSGTQATTVRVTARAMRDDGSISSAQSSRVAITTGIPDNDSFSVSAETLNIEGNNFDGTTTAINVRAADRFNNPVPDGTAINFTTEGGAIPGSCVTENGACSVNLVSQDPRPVDGRATVRVTAIGEETFVDSSPSNGRFDNGETFVDLPEAFRDDNENGTRDPSEVFVDFNSNGSYDGPSGSFTGLLCNPDANCDSSETLNVRRNIEIVFSASSFLVDINPQTIDLNSGAKSVQVTLIGPNNQPPPAGTTVTASTTQGTVEDPASFTVPNTNADQPFSVSFLVTPGDEAEDGVFQVVVTTPVSNTISRGTAAVDQTPSAPPTP